MKIQRILQEQLKTAQADTRPKFLIELAKLPQKEFQNFFYNTSKNKTLDTQARQKSTRQMTITDDVKMVVTHDRQELQPITAPKRNWRFSG